jgi:hypothetical protein
MSSNGNRKPLVDLSVSFLNPTDGKYGEVFVGSIGMPSSDGATIEDVKISAYMSKAGNHLMIAFGPGKDDKYPVKRFENDKGEYFFSPFYKDGLATDLIFRAAFGESPKGRYLRIHVMTEEGSQFSHLAPPPAEKNEASAVLPSAQRPSAASARKPAPAAPARKAPAGNGSQGTGARKAPTYGSR